LEEIRREQELIDEHAGIPLERLIATPALALLRFRELAGQVNQIALMTDEQAMDRLMTDGNKVDVLDQNIWKIVKEEHGHLSRSAV
jgi:hypothetical protein